jgi:hypothetical protein
MGDPGGVGGGGTEGNPEYLVVVVRGYREDLGAGLLVTVHGAVGTVFRDNVGVYYLVGGVGDWEERGERSEDRREERSKE